MTDQLGFLERAPGEGNLERVTTDAGPARMTATARGRVAASEASERIPGFVLDALGTALMRYNTNGGTFTFESVRLAAEAHSEAVRAWLAVATRRNVLGGWTRSRIRLFDLQRCGDVEAKRDARRGARATLWRFPK